MDNNAMNFLRKRLSLLIAAILAATMSLAALPAAAQEISPEHLALARKYIDLTDKANVYEGMLLSVAIDTMRTIVQQNPELVNQTDEAIKKSLDAYREKKGDLLDQFARVYALNFTQEELTQIVAFYESPVGQKLATANATLNENIQTVVGVFEGNLGREFFAKVRAELKAAGFDV
ncbi:MAG TPA: DUF2059 domain-containing protein [Devosia sp.]